MPQDTNVLSFPKPVQSKEKKRRKGERADGRFCTRVRIKGEKNPKPFYGKTKKEADAKAAEFKKRLNAGMNPIDANITVSNWCKRWVDTVSTGKSYSTKQDYEKHVRHLSKALGHMKMIDVRMIHLQKFVNSHAGHSKAHIDKIYNYTRHIFNSARMNGIITTDPSLDLVKPKDGTYTGHRILEKWEMELLLNHYDISQAALWAVTMMLSGLRRGEMFALKRDSFDFENNVIHVVSGVHFENHKSYQGKTKTKAGVRDVPMLEPLTSIIRSQFLSKDRDCFATNSDGSPLTEGSFRSQWIALMNQLSKIASGIPLNSRLSRERITKMGDRYIRVSFTPHDLRYTYATMLYDAGVDEKTSQLWMGHTSARMTRDLYAKLTAEQKKKSDQHLKDYFKRFEQPDTQSDTQE